MSSWSVHPRRHQRQWSNVGWSGSQSSRKAKQMAACWYHLNMELMASLSSALLVLSMKHVSTQAYLSPPILRAIWHVLLIFLKPGFATVGDSRTPGIIISWRETSSASLPQVWDRTAYGGVRLRSGKLSRRRVSVLMSLMVVSSS